ncbi:hypothetical protein LBMAG27_13990 [Bacteroidota bacterium]|nr:hypothetical protein LBMAG27_13990 [Bacteroidota bacterium]
MKKKIIIIILLLIVAAVGYGLYQYFRTNAKTADLTADVSISAVDLYNAYSDNEMHSDSLYRMQVIQVTGKVAEIKKDTSGIIILLDGGNGMFGVSCSLQKTDETVQKVEKDSNITIKGICTGMLMDVVLTRCVIVQPEIKQ